MGLGRPDLGEPPACLFDALAPQLAGAGIEVACALAAVEEEELRGHIRSIT